MQSGPAGSYAYTNSLHQDAATQISSGYTAAYDDAGDMQCRAPTSSLTCSGTQTGQKLTYDQLRRLTDWQNQTNSPTSTAHYAYDGEGERVVQNSTVNGTQTITYYLGGYEEVATTNGVTTPTKYYAAGLTTLVSVNSTLSYLVADGIGSASESLSPSGTVLGANLYAPYGSGRYTTGSLSTTKGFTGQLSDPSGLHYFHARYYDGVAGQFTSADTVQGPNRYGYVMGNPETATDPSGQMVGCGEQGLVDGMCLHHSKGTGIKIQSHSDPCSPSPCVTPPGPCPSWGCGYGNGNCDLGTPLAANPNCATRQEAVLPEY